VKAKSVQVELRPGWPMHVGVVINDQGEFIWRAPVARTNPNEALADAKEYLGDTGDIDEQLADLEVTIRARRKLVSAAMSAEQCSCSRCEHRA
jgi:hypothetical protein